MIFFKSKERVRASLQFKNPDKIPVFHGISGDVVSLPITASSNWRPGWAQNESGLFPYQISTEKWESPPWAKENALYQGRNWKKIPHEEVDEWGRIWNFRGRDIDKGHPGRPSLTNIKNIDEYLAQYDLDPSDKSRYEAALKLQENIDPDSYHIVDLLGHGPSQTTSGILGFSKYLVNHVKYPVELKKLLYRVTDFHVKTIEYSFKYGLKPHGFWLTDDLGEQRGPYFNPKVFSEIYEDAYKPIIDTAHEHGAELHWHCCGKIDALLPSIIKWGLDGIELDSPRMSGYTDLRPYRGKIMFWGCVNIQSIYVHGTPEEVEREVWHMVRNLGTKEGGFGAYFYPTPRVLKTPRKNIKAFEKGIEKYGKYENIPESWWDYPVEEKWNQDEVPPLPPS